MVTSILLINGPNLNLLGTREPHIYGSTTLEDIEKRVQNQASDLGATLTSFQSNWEGAIVDKIQEVRGKVGGIIINAGALTHTSVAIRDALSAVAIPFIEVHISNVHKREPFRHHSYLSDKAEAVIVGLGDYGYTAAVDYLLKHYKS
ncbi:Dehydroquinase [Eremomyces bilateralis CBS 781.70]|uniref:Catabolic 3-dehydroquinase n=1 Tax=Eremomyces bilateralis CBS 781.70 TaxID=1392243 RepID=A0A6G1GF98_9PEZI|nr:Dehydroquinase [Eremomyces bilateralis CBS 781.70]KAF1816757.1 Dehydroquinase [Eremomyces bilateralis CBS 781.70]